MQSRLKPMLANIAIGICLSPAGLAQTLIATHATPATTTMTPVTQKTKTKVTSTARVACVSFCSQYRPVSWAIAKQEGFFLKGSIPNRNHNPGDLKTINAHYYPGQIGRDKFGHAIFKNDYWGWAALEDQVRKMCVNEGRYTNDMTIQQIGRKYAADWKRWSKNVARNLNCTPSTTIAELFDIPPVVTAKPNASKIAAILDDPAGFYLMVGPELLRRNWK